MVPEATDTPSLGEGINTEKRPLEAADHVDTDNDHDGGDANSKHADSSRDDDAQGPSDDSVDQPDASTSSSPARDRHGASAPLVANGLTPTASHASSMWISQTLSRPREAALVGLLCCVQLCTLVSFIGPLLLARIIGASLGVEDAPGRLAWLVAGYSLTVGTFILVAGRLGDHFGYRPMLLIGLAWFAVWSMVVGLAVLDNGGGGGFVLVVFARVLQGIGPALCLPNALAVLGAAYPPGFRKAMVFSFFGAVAPIGGVTGGVMGSVLALAWWPWAFWALAIFLAALGVVGYFIIPDVPGHRKRRLADAVAPTSGSARPSFFSRLRILCAELDLLGAAISIAALILFNLGWNMAPINGWARAEAIAPLVLGALLFGVFLFVEVYVSTAPLVPLDALNADVGFVLAAVTCGWATFGIWALYTAQLLEDTRGLSPLHTSAWFVPGLVAGCTAAVFTGKLLGPWGAKPPVVMTIALTAFTVGVTLAATAPVDQTYWGQTFVSMLIIPFGMDMSFPAATLILSGAVRKEHQGIGASLVNTVVNYGISLGVGIAGTVEYYVNDGGGTREQRLKGYRGGFYMGIGLATFGLVTCLIFLERYYRHDRLRTSGLRGEDGCEKGSPTRPDESAGEAVDTSSGYHNHD